MRTIIRPQTGGTVRLSHDYSKRPSWKSYGDGHALIEVTANPAWPTVDLHVAEVPENNRGTKSVYVSLPVEAITKLLEVLGYKITK